MKLNKTMKKFVAYICAIAMVVAGLAGSGAVVSAASYTIEVDGVSYTVGEPSGNYVGFVSQGAFDQQRFGFAWSGAADQTSQKATVVIQKEGSVVKDMKEQNNGMSIWLTDISELDNGEYTVTFTGTGEFTSQVETVPLTISGKQAVDPGETSSPGDGDEGTTTAKEEEPPVEVPEGYTLLPFDWNEIGAWRLYAGNWGEQIAYVGYKYSEDEPLKMSLDFLQTTASDDWLVQTDITFSGLEVGEQYQYVISDGDDVLLKKVFEATATTQKSDTIGLGRKATGTKMELTATCEKYVPPVGPTFPEEMSFEQIIASDYNVLLEQTYTQTSAHGENSEGAMTDGRINNNKYLATASQETNQEVVVTLEKAKKVSDINCAAISFVNNLTNATDFTVAISEDGAEYTTIGTYTTTTGDESTFKQKLLEADTAEVSFDTYKYVKLTLGEGNNNYGYQIHEFALISSVKNINTRPYDMSDVIADPERNLALNKEVTVSSTYANEGSDPTVLTNGSLSDYWSSDWDGALESDYIIVNLGQVYDASEITKVLVNFKADNTFCENYTIEFSEDGDEYTPVATVKKGSWDSLMKTSDASNTTVTDISTTGNVQYVKINMQGHKGWGFQVREVAVVTADPEGEYQVAEPDAEKWQDYGAWSTYFANWGASIATGYTRGGDSLENFSIKIISAVGEWSIQAKSPAISITAEKKYTYKVVLDSDAAGRIVKTKDDVTGTELITTTLVQGENVIEGTFTAHADNSRILLELGDPANNGATITVKNVTVEEAKDDPTTPTETSTPDPDEPSEPEETVPSELTLESIIADDQWHENGQWEYYVGAWNNSTAEMGIDPEDPDHVQIKQVTSDWRDAYAVQLRKTVSGLTPGAEYTYTVDMYAQSNDGKIKVSNDATEHQLVEGTQKVTMKATADESGKVEFVVGMGWVGLNNVLDFSNPVVTDAEGNVVYPVSGDEPTTPEGGDEPTTPEGGDEPTTPEGGDEPTTPDSGNEPTTAEANVPTTAGTDVSTTTASQATTTGADKATSAPTVKKTKVKKATKKLSAKKVKISLKKVKGAKKYQVQISKTKKFKKVLVKKNVKKAKATIKSKKLANKKKLYVRARVVKVVNGVKSYGKWSKAKKMKIKK